MPVALLLPRRLILWIAYAIDHLPVCTCAAKWGGGLFGRVCEKTAGRATDGSGRLTTSSHKYALGRVRRDSVRKLLGKLIQYAG